MSGIKSLSEILCILLSVLLKCAMIGVIGFFGFVVEVKVTTIETYTQNEHHNSKCMYFIMYGMTSMITYEVLNHYPNSNQVYVHPN